MVRQPYSGREVRLLALRYLGVTPDDYDVASLAEVVEFTRRQEVADMILLANLIGYAFHDPKKMPTVEQVLGLAEPPSMTREEYEARLSRLNGR